MEYQGIAPVYAPPAAPTISAHRAWHQDGAPKNSIPALEQAVAGGVDSVEIDVRRLRDGTLVVHHDATLPDGRRLADVDSVALSAYPDVPTLDAWAKRAGELKANALVELKESGYEDDAVRILRRHLSDGQLEFFSFKPAAVRALSRIVPDRPVGLLSEVQNRARTGAELVRDAKAASATFMGLDVRQTQDDVLWHASRNDLGVKVWTVDAPADISRLLADPRVDTVITDRPSLALEIRRLQAVVTSRGFANEATVADDLGVRLLRAVTTIR